MSTASRNALEALHARVAERLADIIENGLPVYEEGVEVGRVPAPAAYIANAIKFLKDNDVTAIATPDSPLAQLVKALPTDEELDTYLN